MKATFMHIVVVENLRLRFCFARMMILCFLLLTLGGTQLSAQNQAPLADTLSRCTEPITPILLCFDAFDPDGDPVKITDASAMFVGSLNFPNDTCLRYTALPGFFGVDTVKIEVCDDLEPPACATNLVTMNIGCVPPRPENDLITISPGGVVVNGDLMSDVNGYTGVDIDIIDNDDGVCNNDITISRIKTEPMNGAVNIVSEQEIRYTPSEDFVGLDSLVYVTCNRCPLCDTAVVVFNVQPRELNCNTDIYDCVSPFNSIELCPEFCDFQANEIFSLEAEAEQGSVNLITGNCATYVPDPEFTGIDIVRFTACNAVGVCETTNAFITVEDNCGLTAPVAQDDAVNTEPGLGIAFNILQNDFDSDGGEISITEVTDPVNGQLEVNELTGEAIYTPDLGFVGIDSFQYTICDPDELCDNAKVTITVSSDCFVDNEYCTQPLTPVNICTRFCGYTGTDTIRIVEATTTFNCSIALLNDTCFQYTPLPGFLGIDNVTIIGCDSFGICDTAYAEVATGCVNPETTNDFATFRNDDLSNINVLGNDRERCGYNLAAIVTVPPLHGSANINEDGILSYTPDAGFAGLDTLFYVACNDCEDIKCDTAMVIVEADAQVDPPGNVVAETDVVQTPFDTPITISVIANDVAEEPNVSIDILPRSGTVELNPDGSITYTPNGDFVGVDYFVYELCNNLGECDKTVVSVTVLAENQENLPPFTNTDTAEGEQGSPLVIDVLTNDSDPEGGPLRVNQVTDPPNGDVIINDDGTITFTPNPNFTGNTSFEYQACDEEGVCTTGAVVVAVGADLSNNPPEASDDTGSYNGQTVLLNVLDNDSDPDNGDEVTVMLIAAPLGGTAMLGSSGNLEYIPDPNFGGTDYLVYQLCDNAEPPLCDTAYVTIFVGDNSLPPTAVVDTAYTFVNNDVTIDVLFNDFDEDHENSELVVQPLEEDPENGLAVVQGDGTVRYIPNAGFTGTDVFMYVICDPLGGCDSTLVYVIVSLPVDASPDIAYTEVNTPVEINVTNNDIGIGLVITNFLDPQNGTVDKSEDGTLIYTPDPDFVGTDYFFYQVCDIANNCELTLVSVLVNPTGSENLPPNAFNDVAATDLNTEVTIDVLRNDSDPEGDELEPSIVQDPTNGSAIFTNGIVSYVPDEDFTGEDVFRYVICDSEDICDTATVIVNVGSEVPTNIAPEAVDDNVIAGQNRPTIIDATNNDEDPNGNDLSIITITPPANGQGVILESGEIQYTPNTNYLGIDNMVYVVCDNGNPILCDTAYVSITVLEQPDDTDIYVETPEDRDIDICLENFLVVDFPIDTIVIYTLPPNGSPYFTNRSDSCVSYSPDDDFTGLDEMIVGACSPTGECDSVRITINVLENVDAPRAINDSDTTAIAVPILIDVLANDSDPDGDPIIIATASDPPNGERSISADGITYIPDPGFIGLDSFTYTISDPNGTTDLAWVYIFVNPIGQDFLNAVSDLDTTNIDDPIDIMVLENDFFPEGEPLTINITEQPVNGTLEIQDSSIIYTPSSGISGVDNFVYEICLEDSTCNDATVTILILNELSSSCEIGIPSGISPNGDGVNDFLNIRGADCYPGASLMIFNRWGDRVYEVENYSSAYAWGGVWGKNGDAVPEGTYFYVLDLNTGDQNDIYKGYVTLRR